MSSCQLILVTMACLYLNSTCFWFQNLRAEWARTELSTMLRFCLYFALVNCPLELGDTPENSLQKLGAEVIFYLESSKSFHLETQGRVRALGKHFSVF